MASESSATRNSRKRRITRAIHAAGSAALAAALAAALQLGTAGAQAREADESSAKSIEESASDSTEESANDLIEGTPTTAPVKRTKKASKPFKPTERIEAESIISFPANI